MVDYGSELLPVDRLDGFFVVSPDWLAAAVPFPDRTERARLLRKGYVAEPGRVHIGGRSCAATILAPTGKDDQYFAEIYETSVDEISEPAVVSPEDRERYWIELVARFGKSEGVLPEQCAEIITSFVEPRLMLAHGDGQATTWGRLRESNYLLVSGAPGSGKTTLLRQWLLWHGDRTRRGQSYYFPLCFSLRHFRAEDTVESALRREAQAMGAPWLARDLKVFAQRGRLAIAFDGIDEVPIEDRTEALQHLRDFTTKYPECRYLVTTRPEVDVPLEVGLLRANLLPFDAPRLRQLAYYHLHAHGSWKAFTARVEAEPALGWIIGNPLALSLVMARYLRREMGPSFVGEIVNSVVEMFIDSWDSRRGIVRTRRRMLSPANKRKLLSAVADRRHARTRSEPPLVDFTEAEHQEAALAMLSEHTGLLMLDAKNEWVFRDRALEDYFRALTWVSALVSRAGDFRDLISKPVATSGTNLARFVAFLSSDADAQIQTVLTKMTHPELRVAVRLTDVISQGLSLPRCTLDEYAHLVMGALEQSLRDATIMSASPHVFCFSVQYRAPDVTQVDELDALVAALHRSRDGNGAEAIRLLVQGMSTSDSFPIARLLEAEGELHSVKTSEGVTWTVTELMPDVPAGPSEATEISTSRAIH